MALVNVWYGFRALDLIIESEREKERENEGEIGRKKRGNIDIDNI